MGLINTYHSNWKSFLETKEVKLEIQKLETFLKTEKYFPEEKNVLRFLGQDPKSLKAIFVGMEPYPSYFIKNETKIPEATGRSFEVKSIENWTDKFKQTSLRNILKAIYLTEYGKILSIDNLREEILNRKFKISKPKEWFDKLEEQGVMFLNTTLTVRQGEVDTHAKEWEVFMNMLIQYINETNPNVIWCLLGNKAKNRILPKIKKEQAIITCHPRINEFVKTDLFKKLKGTINFVV